MKKQVEILINTVFWLIIIAFLCKINYDLETILPFGEYQFHYKKYLIFLAEALPGLIINYYFFYIYLIPLLQLKENLSALFLAIIGSFISGTLMYVLLQDFKYIFENYGLCIFFSVITLLFGIIGGAIKGTILWRNSISERKALEKKHSESKTALLLLKAQLNPHFLFNSLNNIDILIEENPKTASEYLKKLSDILRYVLYETKEDKTDLAKEISQIKSYVELQKIRTANPRYVNFNVNGAIAEQQIAPMIFLPFIENAFKHSKNKTIDNAIDISFEVSNNSVKMVCKNFYEAGQLEIVKNEGLGIETIQQRLNLLYPENHKLTIDKTEHWFKVTLYIQW